VIEEEQSNLENQTIRSKQGSIIEDKAYRTNDSRVAFNRNSDMQGSRATSLQDFAGAMNRTQKYENRGSFASGGSYRSKSSGQINHSPEFNRVEQPV
jgi:hypothetical protein